MSLEALLEANTAALTRLAVAVEASNLGRDAATDKLAAAFAAGEAKPGRGRPTGSKNAAPETPAPATPPAAETPATAGPTEAPSGGAEAPTIDVTTEEGFMASAQGFMQIEVAEKPTEELLTARAARKVFFKAVLDHLGVASARTVKPEDRTKVVSWFAANVAGKTVNFSEGEDDQSTGEDDDMMG